MREGIRLPQHGAGGSAAYIPSKQLKGYHSKPHASYQGTCSVSISLLMLVHVCWGSKSGSARFRTLVMPTCVSQRGNPLRQLPVNAMQEHRKKHAAILRLRSQSNMSPHGLYT